MEHLQQEQHLFDAASPFQLALAELREFDAEARNVQ